MKLSNIVCAVMLGVSALVMSGCGLLDQGVQKYDTLSEKDEKCNQAWADIDAQLERRSDLIPNMVAVVKGSAAHEEKTLNDVVTARASASQIKMSADDLTDPAKMKAFQDAQEQLKGSLSRLMMVQESYPDLKANAQFHDLMITMEGTENRILTARRDYNSAVGSFNFELRRVSGKVLNPLTGKEFKPRVYFTASEESKSAPKVNFDAPIPATPATK
jgi:LemA protein